LCRWALLGVRARHDNSERTVGQSVCFQQRHGGLKRYKKLKRTRYFYQLNGRDLLVIFNSAIEEGLKLYSQTRNLTISHGNLNTLSLNAFRGSTVRFSVVMIGIS
jgi:hypothetical protein